MSAASHLPRDVAEAIGAARRMGIDRLDAHLLLGRLLDRPRSWLLARERPAAGAPLPAEGGISSRAEGPDPHDAGLPESIAAAYLAALQQRACGVPLAYLLGEKEFHGLMLKVQPGVLVPRPDTETLVDWAIDCLTQGPASPRVLDLGTGSGAIALAVKSRCPTSAVTATDVSEAALAVAAANGARLGLAVHWLHGDWWQAVPAGAVYDLVLSNPPYVAEGDPHLDALRHEPSIALTSGPEGLDALRHIVAGTAGRLAPGGWLLLEHGHDQAGAVRALLLEAGLLDVGSRRDLGGHERCSGGRRA